uniref:Tubulin monoglycylase TTLL3-like n=1 Tax=Neolamprologus brichardi TaxID=32507 RepID=A0A3Q4HXX1_NEOBR
LHQHQLMLPTTHPEVTFVILPALDLDKLREARVLVDKAVKMHKVFSIQGRYPVIREGLRARGWVERCIVSKHRVRRHQSSRNRTGSNYAVCSDRDDGELEALHNVMSRLVWNEMVYFYWTNRRKAINTKNLHKEQITNHFSKACNLTTKTGLCLNLRKLHWFDSADPDTFFPRCYRLAALDERHAFIDDYRRTACTSLLKYIVEKDQYVQGERISHTIQAVKGKKKQSKRQSSPVNISQMINKALKVCEDFLQSLEHSDIDTNLETQQTPAQEWAEFLDSYYLVVHGGAEIDSSDYLVIHCKAMLQRMKIVNPQLEIEGIHNIWIIKPGAKSRGRGIKCANRLDQILDLVKGDPKLIKENKWVVQKYLEHPFLVHDTKFDVRQWFLVTDWNPLTVWFYKKCYLRFSTQPYTLDSMDSSVHLCNNSIQKRLRPLLQRHRSIPEDNMWSVDQFKTFLCTKDREAQWDTVVVPGMKRALIYALQTAQDLIESRKNTFELYGADFMLDRDLHPWLLEINSSPTMAPSTPVTAHLCAAVQEDTLRVVLDRRVKRTANTGDFQLIYKKVRNSFPFVMLYVYLNGDNDGVLQMSFFIFRQLCWRLHHTVRTNHGVVPSTDPI